MPLGFHPDRYVAFPSDHAILLDVARDRYPRLDPTLSGALREVLADVQSCDPATIALLKQHDILRDAATSRPLNHAAGAVSPTSQMTVRTGVDPNFAGTAMATLAIRFRLRRLGLKHSLVAASGRAARASVEDPATALVIANRFAAHRAWLPLPRACLPDGLALHAVLSRAGISARMIIGVRDRPFAAHCWVQAGDQLLGEQSETIA